ncbi:MAG: DUF1456 family protein [Saprospiraceae bacterium]
MKNNYVLRQLRYIFDLNDEQMIDLFAQAEVVVARTEVSNWLKREEHPDYQRISDSKFASFLNGFINHKRGKRPGPQPAPEKRLNNNIIFRKLKIALNYKDTDIINTYDYVGMHISKHELSAIFRHPSQNQYRDCEDQFLRNFLYGLKKKYRPAEE